MWPYEKYLKFAQHFLNLKTPISLKMLDGTLSGGGEEEGKGSYHLSYGMSLTTKLFAAA